MISRLDWRAMSAAEIPKQFDLRTTREPAARDVEKRGDCELEREENSWSYLIWDQREMNSTFPFLQIGFNCRSWPNISHHNSWYQKFTFRNFLPVKQLHYTPTTLYVLFQNNSAFKNIENNAWRKIIFIVHFVRTLLRSLSQSCTWF